MSAFIHRKGAYEWRPRFGLATTRYGWRWFRGLDGFENVAPDSPPKFALESEREFVTGETHYFEGERYRLDVLEGVGRPGVKLRNRRIMELRAPTGADRNTKEAILHRWYRRKLQARIPALQEEWEAKIGVRAQELRIKKMKTLWGSCNTKASRIWLNLELAKKPPTCLAFVLAHELVHLLERHHTERFIEMMDTAMPQWRLHRDELNRAPLAHEDWGY